jgi:hypothetical protein
VESTEPRATANASSGLPVIDAVDERVAQRVMIALVMIVIDEFPEREGCINSANNCRQAIAGRHDASVEHPTAVRHDSDLTFLLVEIDGTIRHGWSSPLRLKSAFSVRWSASYHVTEETSRFTLSTGFVTRSPPPRGPATRFPTHIV